MKILLLLVVAIGLSAESVTVTGDTVEVVNERGTTVVKGANGRAAGQMVGSAAKIVSDMGVGIADAFDGKRAKVQAESANGNAKVIINNADANTIIAVDEGDEEIVEQKGSVLQGKYSISVAGNDGSAKSFQGCRDVEIFKDGQVENNSEDAINFSGSVMFTTGMGEQRKESGIITVAKE